MLTARDAVADNGDAAGPDGILSTVGSCVVSFASNDYLGLTQHRAVKAADPILERFARALDEELAAGRCIEEQLLYGDRCPRGERGWHQRLQRAAFHFESPSVRLASSA